MSGASVTLSVMLAHHDHGGRVRRAPGPDDDPAAAQLIRAALAEAGPLLYAASRAADGPNPRAGLASLRRAAQRILAITS